MRRLTKYEEKWLLLTVLDLILHIPVLTGLTMLYLGGLAFMINFLVAGGLGLCCAFALLKSVMPNIMK